MHIPDGYLSPQTCVVIGAVAIPIIGIAAIKLKKTLKDKQVPLLAIGAAFSFTIMMYNVPIPDGTTAHAVGASLLAIILGPWAAVVGVSIALIIQAFFFGDGGILTLGANIFNMAFVMPFVSYYIYKLISGNSEISSKRRFIGSIIAGYVAINIGALCTGIELGLQPLLFHKLDGTPLYAPYTLMQTLPAMMFAHLVIAGPVEGIVTGLVVKYMQKSNPAMLMIYPPKKSLPGKFQVIGSLKKYWYVLITLIIFAPLGLLAKGTAFGEWSGDDLKSKLGFIPEGMVKLSDKWNFMLPDYSVPGFGDNFFKSSLGYIFCAIVALIIILAITGVISFLQKRKNATNNVN
ncbi:cobalt transporter CbiM [Clostridium estertheticum]|uniref:cobalt transporter CbiM n=1 Tax=Clostridium estertheticum TaxID=238834 RepID=UPI001C7CEF12|nr:cobalt transporter CbiM [Clostridium estertheticum]MBX4258583.1 cobalt transporter CbiM [Clostridium estertheticum]WLC69941.1 cobalt transporter CbiM [Clostridium estertheticum]